MKKTLARCTFIFFVLINTNILAQSQLQEQRPRLIVQIVVDQLRGDLLTQYSQNFGPNGFNQLLAHAINYQNAHHPHASTVTCVGHATISTGSSPSLHGIIANDWYDPVTKKINYCTDDPQSPLLPTSRSKLAKSVGPGQSPRNLVASTFSDELILAERGRAFAVSLKDRAAITLAGHAGKAFWFDKLAGGFISSQHYYHHYPQWVNQWNQHYQPKNERWELLNPIEQYRYSKVLPIPQHFPGFGDTFPHQLGLPDSPNYYQYLAMTPFADALTADFAIALLKAEKLGKSAQKTDYLAVSFSVVDVIGHHFGPHSLEAEDNLQRLDQTIARLLKAIDEQVGLNHTLIVLTADHGMVDSPNWLHNHKMDSPRGLDIPHLKNLIIQSLHKHYQLPAEALALIKPPYIYLNHDLLFERKLSVVQVANTLAERLKYEPEFFAIYPLPLHSTPEWLSKKVAKMNFPHRSGDLYLISKPYQNISDYPGMALAHGSPWNYDSYVPLLFVNPQFKPMRISRAVSTTDIAVTLTALLAIKPPSAAIGNPLEEVIEHLDNSQ